MLRRSRWVCRTLSHQHTATHTHHQPPWTPSRPSVHPSGRQHTPTPCQILLLRAHARRCSARLMAQSHLCAPSSPSWQQIYHWLKNHETTHILVDFRTFFIDHSSLSFGVTDLCCASGCGWNSTAWRFLLTVPRRSSLCLGHGCCASHQRKDIQLDLVVAALGCHARINWCGVKRQEWRHST